MKSDKLQCAIGKIDVELIEAADKKQPAAKRGQIWRSAGPAAVCLALAVMAVSGPRLMNHSVDTPVSPVSNAEGLNGAGGTDGKINLTAAIERTGEDCILTAAEANAFMNEGLPAYREELKASGKRFGAFFASSFRFTRLSPADKKSVEYT